METTSSTRHSKLLGGIAVLLAIVVVLQVAILLQRPSSGSWESGAAGAYPGAAWWSRLTNRLHPPPPMASSPTPDTVWDDFNRQIERMHSQISRMFEEAGGPASSLPAAVTATSAPPGSATLAMDPSRHMHHIRRQIDAMFAGARQSPDNGRMGFDDGWSDLAVTPGLGIRDTGNAYEVTVQLPGFDRSSIRVTLDGTFLDIAAERQQVSGNARIGNGRMTQSTSRFERRLRLPHAVTRPEAAEATYRNGVLRIVVPKAPGDAQESGRVPVI